MSPYRKTAPEAPSTMKELKDTLWKAADNASDATNQITPYVFISTDNTTP